MNAVTKQFVTLYKQAFAIWVSGGKYMMTAIAVAALVMFALGIYVYLKLSSKGFTAIREKIWRHWVDHPEERMGYIGELLNFATGGTSIKDTATFFEELQMKEITSFERDLRVMKICVSAAPLLGLLGTVIGMLATFTALASGSGGEKTMTQIAEGISVALVTTETGLIIALAGLFMHYLLVRKLERYKAFLAHLEAICTQKLYKKLHQQNRNASQYIRQLQPDIGPAEAQKLVYV